MARAQVAQEAHGARGHLGQSAREAQVRRVSSPRRLVEGARSRFELVTELARRDNLTLRQHIGRLGGGRGHRTFAEYTGRTLREHYGIPRPDNVFTTAGPETRADVA